MNVYVIYVYTFVGAVLCFFFGKVIYRSFYQEIQLVFPENGDICEANGFRRRATPKKVYNIFPINNELQLLDIRLHVLSEVIEKFAIVESPTSYSGNKKPLFFQESREQFSAFDKQIQHMVIQLDSFPGPFEKQEATRSALLEVLDRSGAQPDDLVLMGDLDELPDPRHIRFVKECEGYDYPVVFRIVNYLFDFRCVMEQPPWVKVKILPRSYFIPKCYQPGKKVCPDEIRDPLYRVEKKLGEAHPLHLGTAGWHLSYFFGMDKIIYKINNYLHTDRNTPENNNVEHVSCLICRCRQTNKWDYGTRSLEVNLSSLPPYIQRNADNPDYKYFFRNDLIKEYCLKYSCL